MGIKSLWVAMLLWICSGCVMGPDYQKPSFNHDQAWHNDDTKFVMLSDQKGATNMLQWWQQFDDPVLDALMRDTLRFNYDLKSGLAHLQQAHHLRSGASSIEVPQVGASASVNRSRFSRQTGFGNNTGIRNSYTTTMDASWEVDLFGRVQRTIEIADAELAQQEAIYHDLMLSVLAETAMTYFELRGLQVERRSSEHTVDLLREMESIVEAQWHAGMVSEHALWVARSERQNAQAVIPSLTSEINSRIYRLSVLVGEPPEVKIATLADEAVLPAPKDRVPLGLRSDLLERRSDVRIAAQRLHAATSMIGLAEAARFPSFSLTGAVGSSARSFGDLFTASTITSALGAALAWPIYDGGRLRAEIAAATAGNDAAIADYQQSMLLALEDVEGALTRYGEQWQSVEIYQKLLKSRKEALRLTQIRYESGAENFLNVIQAERDWVSANNSAIQSQTALLVQLVALYKALGGDWIASTESKE
ncbi:MAG: efflux transporter outer membrane subunit [Zetaproteobacteria bacterium]|nr:efflux transporter outer membrane subunit [Zetaproteobacteria bacterium]